MKSRMTILGCLLAATAMPWFAALANTTVHTGKVLDLSVGYGGNTVTFMLEGFGRTNCTCYSTWASHMCLDRESESFPRDKALLLTARMAALALVVEIDDTTCRVSHMYTTD